NAETGSQGAHHRVTGTYFEGTLGRLCDRELSGTGQQFHFPACRRVAHLDPAGGAEIDDRTIRQCNLAVFTDAGLQPFDADRTGHPRPSASAPTANASSANSRRPRCRGRALPTGSTCPAAGAGAVDTCATASSTTPSGPAASHSRLRSSEARAWAGSASSQAV